MNVYYISMLKSLSIMIEKLIIASRKSPLAIWQAEYIKSKIQTLYPKIVIIIKGFKTQGDLILDQSLATVGGKGLFIKELEQALLEKKAHLAVHSMKDLPMDIPQNFSIAAITKREDPRDAFISNKFQSLGDLPKGSVVGTSSLRRQSQIKSKFPHLVIKPLRGNLQTRINKLDDNKYSAIILAAAGLIRLGLKDRIKTYLNPNEYIPAVGQGALGIEILKDDKKLLDILKFLNDNETMQCVKAERAVSRALAGNCNVPLGAHATIKNQLIKISGFVAKPDGREFISDTLQEESGDPEKIGKKLSKNLIEKGALRLLK